MAYAIIRSKKLKTGIHIRNLSNHNYRIKTDKIKGLIPSRSHLNVYEGAQNPDEVTQAIRKRVATCTQKVRPKSVRCIEFVVTASATYFKGKPYEEQLRYLKDSVDCLKQEFGADNVIAVSYHFDERTPHAHVEVVPIETSVRKTKHTEKVVTTLNAKAFLGGQEKMIGLQDKFHAFVTARGHDLKRGEPKAETKAEHQSTNDYWIQLCKDVEAEKALYVGLVAEYGDHVHKAKKRLEEVKNREADYKKAVIEYNTNVRNLKEIRTLAKRPELYGMLNFLSENESARQMLDLIKNDPASLALLKSTIEAQKGLGVEGLQPAQWQAAPPVNEYHFGDDQPRHDQDYSM